MRRARSTWWIRFNALALEGIVHDILRRAAEGMEPKDHEVEAVLAYEHWWALAPGGDVTAFPNANKLAEMLNIAKNRARRILRGERWADQLKHDADKRDRWQTEVLRRRNQTANAAATNAHRKRVREWMKAKHPHSRVDPEAVARLCGPHGRCLERVAEESSVRCLELAREYETRASARGKPRKRLLAALRGRLRPAKRSRGARRDRKLREAVSQVRAAYVERTGLKHLHQPPETWAVDELVAERVRAMQLDGVADPYAAAQAEIRAVLQWGHEAATPRASRLRERNLLQGHFWQLPMYIESLVEATTLGYTRPPAAAPRGGRGGQPGPGLALPDRSGLWAVCVDGVHYDTWLTMRVKVDGDQQLVGNLVDGHGDADGYAWVDADEMAWFRRLPDAPGCWTCGDDTVVVRSVDEAGDRLVLADGEVQMADLYGGHWAIVASPARR